MGNANSASPAATETLQIESRVSSPTNMKQASASSKQPSQHATEITDETTVVSMSTCALTLDGNEHSPRTLASATSHMTLQDDKEKMMQKLKTQQMKLNGQLPHRVNRLRTHSIQQNVDMPDSTEEENIPIPPPNAPQTQNSWNDAWFQDDDEDDDSDHDDNSSDEDLTNEGRKRLDTDISKQVDTELRQGEYALNAWETDLQDGKEDEVYVKPHVEMFSQLRVLGKGSFGKVILTQKQIGKEKGQLFAMKVLRKTHLLKKQQIARTRTERKVLSMVDHPFIMKLHFAFQTENKLFIVLDYCAGGELFFHLSRHKRFSEGWTRFYTAELLLALEHLHSRGIIYRDLKPENILLDSQGHVKLGDFGLAKLNIRHPYEGAKSRVGTPEYMAPEVIQKQSHGFTVDYWGLGMVTYEMMTGLPPWYTEDRSKIFKRLLRDPLVFPSEVDFSPHLASFIASLLNRRPTQRLGVKGPNSVKRHSFFRRLDFNLLEDKRVQAPILPCQGWKPPKPETEKKNKLLGMFSGQRQVNTGKLEAMRADELDEATANFDKTFTRMTLDSDTSHEYHDESSDDGYASSSHREELTSNSFVGFTFEDHTD